MVFEKWYPGKNILGKISSDSSEELGFIFWKSSKQIKIFRFSGTFFPGIFFPEFQNL